MARHKVTLDNSSSWAIDLSKVIYIGSFNQEEQTCNIQWEDKTEETYRITEKEFEKLLEAFLKS